MICYGSIEQRRRVPGKATAKFRDNKSNNSDRSQPASHNFFILSDVEAWRKIDNAQCDIMFLQT